MENFALSYESNIFTWTSFTLGLVATATFYANVTLLQADHGYFIWRTWWYVHFEKTEKKSVGYGAQTFETGVSANHTLTFC